MTSQRFRIRKAEPRDAVSIANIYNVYIRDTIITFEQDPVGAEDIVQRLAQLQEKNLPWLVIENAASMLCGYAYAGEWKPRVAYRHTVEVSVYLDADRAERGMGSALYAELFSCLPQLGVHSALAGIALPNEVSIGLHEKFGMTKVAHMTEVGYKFGKWIDVGYWQRVFDGEGLRKKESS